MALIICRARGLVGVDAPVDLAESDAIYDVSAILEPEAIDKFNPHSSPDAINECRCFRLKSRSPAALGRPPALSTEVAMAPNMHLVRSLAQRLLTAPGARAHTPRAAIPKATSSSSTNLGSQGALPMTKSKSS